MDGTGQWDRPPPRCGVPARFPSGHPDRQLPSSAHAPAGGAAPLPLPPAGRLPCCLSRRARPPPVSGFPQVFTGVLVSVLPSSVSVSRPEPSPTTTLGPSLPSSALPALTLFCSLSHCAAAAMPSGALIGLPQTFTGALTLVLPVPTMVLLPEPLPTTTLESSLPPCLSLP